MIMLIVLVAAIWRLFTRGNCIRAKLLPKKQEKPTNPNTITQNTFVDQVISTVLYIFPVLPYQCRLWSVGWGGVQSVECEDSGVLRGEFNVQDMQRGLRCGKCGV